MEAFNLDDITGSALAERIIQNAVSDIRDKAEAKPGVDYITKLIEKNGLPMAIDSSAPYVVLDASLGRLGIGDRINAVHSAWDEEKGKPDPAVFLTTAKKLGVAPESSLVIEDAVSGVKAAKAAGMKVFAVPESHPEREGFKLADGVFESLAHITWIDIHNLK